MRAPLSWLRDFAPFPDDVGALRAALDDLGLVVEAVEHVGEGLGDVVVSRVLEISPIEGADKIRLVIVDAGGRAARDRVRRAQLRGGGPGPAGAGRRHPAGRLRDRAAQDARRRRPTGCSARAGARALRRRRRPARPGRRVAGRAGHAAHGGARPPSPTSSSTSRSRATVPTPGPSPGSPATWRAASAFRSPCPSRPSRPPSGWPVEAAATASVESPDLCPRLTVTVLDHVTVGPSPRLDRPAAAAGRHAPDQQRRRRVELRHARAGPAHPPLRPGAAARPRADACAGPGRARPSRRSTGWSARSACGGGASATPARTASSATPRARRSASAGSWAARRRRSPRRTTEVLLEAAYFAPMAIARTLQAPRPAHRGVGALRARLSTPGASSRRCGASASCWPRASPGSRWPTACSTCAARCPSRSSSRCRSPGCTARSASSSDARRSPGSSSRSASRSWSRPATTGGSTVVVPTNRPDVRREPYGVDDVIEEIARTFGYSNVPRHVPTWPQPGG